MERTITYHKQLPSGELRCEDLVGPPFQQCEVPSTVTIQFHCLDDPMQFCPHHFVDYEPRTYRVITQRQVA